MVDDADTDASRSARPAAKHGFCILAVILLVAVVIVTLPYYGYRDDEPIWAIIIIAATMVSIMHIRRCASGSWNMLAYVLIPALLGLFALGVYLDYVIAGYRMM